MTVLESIKIKSHSDIELKEQKGKKKQTKWMDAADRRRCVVCQWVTVWGV